MLDLLRILRTACSSGVLVCLLVAVLNVGSARAAAPGQELFEMNCAVCHGKDGVSILPNAPHFAKGDRLEKTDDLLFASIADGLNVMPPWKNVLSEEQISEILVYVRTLAK